MTENIRGYNKQYDYLATVKSVKELEELGLKVIGGQD
jgi:hypothetical protein